MIDTYKVTMPTPEKARSCAVKLEGQADRTGIWLQGLAFGLKAVDSNIFFKNTHQTKTALYFQTDSVLLVDDIRESLAPYCITVEKVEKA